MDPTKRRAELAEKATDADDLDTEMQMHAQIIAVLEQQAGGKKLLDAYPLADVQMSFWKQNGRWVLAGILVLLVVWIVVKSRMTKKAAPPAAPGVGGFPPPGTPPTNYPPANYPPPGGFPPPGAPPTNFGPPPGT